MNIRNSLKMCKTGTTNAISSAEVCKCDFQQGKWHLFLKKFDVWNERLLYMCRVFSWHGLIHCAGSGAYRYLFFEYTHFLAKLLTKRSYHLRIVGHVREVDC